jgi:hypothetical protein
VLLPVLFRRALSGVCPTKDNKFALLQKAIWPTSTRLDTELSVRIGQPQQKYPASRANTKARFIPQVCNVFVGHLMALYQLRRGTWRRMWENDVRWAGEDWIWCSHIDDYEFYFLDCKYSSAWCLFHGGFLLGSLFDPENGGDMFLRNVGRLSLHCVICQKIKLCWEGLTGSGRGLTQDTIETKNYQNLKQTMPKKRFEPMNIS